MSRLCDKSVASSVTGSVDYTPFITEGAVSFPGSEEMVPVRILRDTGAAQSFFLEGMLLLTSETASGTHVLVRGFEMGFVEVPLHQIHLSSAIVSGNVVVGVCPALPGPGITFILGNDLAGGNVCGKSSVAAPPIVVCVPRKSDVLKNVTKNSLICSQLVQSPDRWLNNYLKTKLQKFHLMTPSFLPLMQVNQNLMSLNVLNKKTSSSLPSDQAESTVLQSSESADTSKVTIILMIAL